MLVRLNNKAIVDNWDLFKSTIEQAVPKTYYTRPDRNSVMLEAALLGNIQCWVGLVKDETRATIITQVGKDYFSGHSSLLIYAIRITDHISREERDVIWKTLQEFGRAQGCQNIITHSSGLQMARAALKVNEDKGHITYFVTLPIEGR